MTKKNESLCDLAMLESFDPDAFRGDDNVPQYVCNFVVALALVFNDLRDLVQLHNLIVSKKPPGTFQINRQWGGYNGAWLHSLRLMVAFIHEVLKLVHANQKTLRHPFFKGVFKQIPREAREHWSSLVQAAEGKQINSSVGKFALFVRNKLVFHYDPKEIFSGYSLFFSSQSHGSAAAFVSRGVSMSQTRYFFADAAARGYFTRDIQGQKAEDLLMKVLDLMEGLSFSLMCIIHHFIQKRGFAYRTAKEET